MLGVIGRVLLVGLAVVLGIIAAIAAFFGTASVTSATTQGAGSANERRPAAVLGPPEHQAVGVGTQGPADGQRAPLQVEIAPAER
jgi:hypothetical protein